MTAIYLMYDVHCVTVAPQDVTSQSRRRPISIDECEIYGVTPGAGRPTPQRRTCVTDRRTSGPGPVAGRRRGCSVCAPAGRPGVDRSKNIYLHGSSPVAIPEAKWGMGWCGRTRRPLELCKAALWPAYRMLIELRFDVPPDTK